MPAAPGIATKIVEGTLHTPDAAAIPVVGSIRFIPSVEVQDTSGHVVVVAQPIYATLDGSGSFAIELSVTDDPDAQPQNWTWRMKQLWPGGREVDFFLPTALPGPVDISTILPASPVESMFQYASISDVATALATIAATDADLNDRMDDIDLSAAVVTAAVVIHPFLYSAW